MSADEADTDGDATTSTTPAEDRRDPDGLPDRDRLVALRRAFHRHPEPAWREFRTTARIVTELERIGVDELYVGPEMLASDARTGVPERAELDAWLEDARAAGVDDDLLERMADGHTGALAVIEGEDPESVTIGLRVDIDGLPRAESTDSDHVPAAEGFRSETGAMHACGHDAHATYGLAVVEALRNGGFTGTVKIVFQPAEEVVGGGRPVAESGHFDDVDYLLAVHVGLDHPTGEVVAGIDGFLAVNHFEADFTGAGAHAGASPDEGHNAAQAAAVAVQNLYGIARHQDGATRINAGVLRSGTATNIVPEDAHIAGEVRGETTALKDYMRDRAVTVLEAAATMHDCSVEISTAGEAPSAASDDVIRAIVAGIAAETAGVTSVLDSDDLGGSEDASYLMRRVQERGGAAAYVGVGTDHPGGHHSATFDVDEDSLPIGAAVLTRTIRRLAAERP